MANTLFDWVKDTLASNPSTRESDSVLWKEFLIENKTLFPNGKNSFVLIIDNKELLERFDKFKSIEKYRRVIQNQQDLYKASKQTQARRVEKEREFISEFKGVVS